MVEGPGLFYVLPLPYKPSAQLLPSDVNDWSEPKAKQHAA